MISNSNLWLHIQNGNFPLLVDLLDSFNFGAKHVSLKAAILQQFILRDAFSHGFVGDEIIFLSVLLILTWGSGGVWCVKQEEN